MKLQIGRVTGAQLISMLPLALAAFCLLEFVLQRYNGVYREYAAAFLATQWMLLSCLVVWCASFLFLTFGWKDLPLTGLLLIIIIFYFIGYAVGPSMDALTLLAGMTLGKGVRSALMEDGESKLFIPNPPSSILNFLRGLVGLLAFASWWHLDMSDNYYHGPRWMGLWDNPNTYGMLMGAGLTLAIGLLAANAKIEDRRWRMKGEGNPPSPSYGATRAASGNIRLRFLRPFVAIKSAILHPSPSIHLIAIFMLGVGLVMSYSRGAWLGTAIGLLYLAWSYDKLKWRYVLPVAAVAATVVLYHWGNTPDSAPWYVKRVDLGRPSAQNRAMAWRAGLEIMRDYPLGVGWNQVVRIYGEQYHPPEGGPGALTTNDYLMIGTELGIPALLCFVAYAGLCYRRNPRPLIPALSPLGGQSRDKGEALRAACLAGALVFVVAFWFDDGLFKLPTAAMFWVLLELGAAKGGKVDSRELLVTRPKTE